MITKILINAIAACVVTFVLLYLLNAAFGADLRLPHHTMQVVPLPPPARPSLVTPIAPAIPSSNTPQLCLENGKEPFPGQTLQADITCPTGLRWRFQK